MAIKFMCNMPHINKLHKLLQFVNKNKYIQRKCCAKVAESNEISSRQHAWLIAQQKYANYEHVLYSSYLESEFEPKNRWQHTHRPLKIVYPKLEDIEDNSESVNRKKVPDNWLDDYEFYAGTITESDAANYGTPDPNVPMSLVPCNGCGAHLHCTSTTVPGYIPSEIFKGRSIEELKTILCQRCHFLKHYNIALNVDITPESYIETISSIKDQFALAIIIVDLLDFPCSIWPGMQNIVGNKRPIFIVGNKVDLLPRDSTRSSEHVKENLRNQFIQQGGFDSLNIKYISLISAKTGYGIEELITQLHKIWKYKGDVYLMGCANVGKSTLFNILLNSDYCRPQAAELVRKATTCPWPGTTLQMLKFPILRPSDIRVYGRYQRLNSERELLAHQRKLREKKASKTGNIKLAELYGHVGRTFINHYESQDAFAMSSGTQPIETLNERAKEYTKAKWCYDTPGVIQPDQLTNLLTPEELLKLQPRKMIVPRAYRFKPKMSLLLAGLARLDFIDCDRDVDWIKLFVFASNQLPIVLTNADNATQVYEQYLGTPLLGVPMYDGEDKTRMERWPGLQCKQEDIVLKGFTKTDDKPYKEETLKCDIVLSSAGWIGFSLPEDKVCTFRAWTPHARGIYVRDPPLVPLANRLIGKHIRNSLAYNTTKPFVYKK